MVRTHKALVKDAREDRRRELETLLGADYEVLSADGDREGLRVLTETPCEVVLWSHESKPSEPASGSRSRLDSLVSAIDLAWLKRARFVLLSDRDLSDLDTLPRPPHSRSGPSSLSLREPLMTERNTS